MLYSAFAQDEESIKIIIKSSDTDEISPVNSEELKTDSDIGKTEKEEALADEKIESEEERVFRRDIIRRVNEIIEKVQLNYPVLSARFSEYDEVSILQSIANTMNRGIEYIPADHKTETIQPSEIPRPEYHPGIIISSNKILFIRVDNFSQNMLSKFKEDCLSSARLSKSPVGVIIDLRSAYGSDYNAALQALTLFCKPEDVPLPSGVASFNQIMKSPVILLVGEKTSGSAEIFASLLMKNKRAIILGSSSLGSYFTKTKIPLSNGDYLLIPVVPDNLKNLKSQALKPSILFPPYPQISYDKLRNELGSEKSDKCLKRAVDLIICLDALSETKN